MAELRWNLESLLEAHKVTRYELAQNMGGNVKTRLTSLYRMRDPKRIDLTVTGDIVAALRRITGEEVMPNDLLEFVPDPEPEPEPAGPDVLDAETRAWQDDEIGFPVEPYSWDDDVTPEDLGEPLYYDEELGWVKDG